MAAPPRQPPELVGDAIAEILLRVPPKEPAHLVRASLVCKPWRRVLTDPAFLRRYRRFHGAPPLLGFFNNIHSAKHVPRFVPTTATASPLSSSAAFDCRPLDCRHGRVLFEQTDDTDEFLVWYPITGAREEVPEPNIRCWSAAVLCATAGCDHSSCHGGGPFLVVCVGFKGDWHAYASVYSSQAHAWGASVHLDVGVLDYCCGHLDLSRPVIVGDGIYLVPELNARIAILKYDLGRHHLSIFALLPASHIGNLLIMPTEDSLLGLASIKGSRLCLRSRIVNGDAAPRWVTYRVIDLQTVLPVTIPINQAKVIGFAEGVNVIFVATDVGTFIIDLESERSRKVSEHCINRPVIPLMSYYTPGMVISQCLLMTLHSMASMYCCQLLMLNC
jgi:hypothetical protein